MPRQSVIDPIKFEELCIHQNSEKDIADFFGVDRTTINRFCKKTFNASFASFCQQKRTEGKEILIGKAIKLAEKNGAVMIFLLKNWAGMTDTPAQEAKNIGVTDEMKEWFKKVQMDDEVIS